MCLISSYPSYPIWRQWMLQFRGSKEALGRQRVKPVTSQWSLCCPAGCLCGYDVVAWEVKSIFGASMSHTPCQAARLPVFLFWDPETCDLLVHLCNKGRGREHGLMIFLMERIRGNWVTPGNCWLKCTRTCYLVAAVGWDGLWTLVPFHPDPTDQRKTRLSYQEPLDFWWKKLLQINI